MNTVPLWAVVNLGKKVILTEDFDDFGDIYKAGSTGTLISIQAPIDGWQSLHVSVALDADNDISIEHNFTFDQLKPATGVLGCFHLEEGLIDLYPG